MSLQMQRLSRSILGARQLLVPSTSRRTSTRHFGASNEMVSSMKICVLGSGNMAEAIISALSKNKLQNMQDICCYDINPDRIAHLKSLYGITPCQDVSQGMETADITFLSVKPQNVTTLAKSLSKPPRGLLLSIVAGRSR